MFVVSADTSVSQIIHKLSRRTLLFIYFLQSACVPKFRMCLKPRLIYFALFLSALSSFNFPLINCFFNPQDWQPPFAVEVDNFHFTPRIQRLNELEVCPLYSLGGVCYVVLYCV